MFAIKYSLQCLSLYSQNNSTSASKLGSTLEELLLDKKIEELFLHQQQAAKLPSLSTERQDKHADVINHRTLACSPPSFSATSHVCANSSAGGDGDGDHDMPDLVAGKDVVPEQEQFMRSPGLAGMGVPHPPPLHHHNYSMMMQRPPPPPHLPPFMVPSPGHMPVYYPMMHPHLSMPPVMGFMPFMPPMVAPANLPAVEQQQQQLDSSTSSPCQVSTEDQQAEKDQTLQGDVNVIPVKLEKQSEMMIPVKQSEMIPVKLEKLSEMVPVNLEKQSEIPVKLEKQSEKQSEMVASNAFPIPSLAITQPSLRKQSTEPLTMNDPPPISSSPPLGLSVPKHTIFTATPPNVDMITSHSKDRSEEEVKESEGRKEAMGETVVKKPSVVTQSFVSMVKDDVAVDPQVEKPSSNHGTIKPTLKSAPLPHQFATNHSTTTQHSLSSVNPPQHTSARNSKKSMQCKSDRTESNQPGLPCRPSSNQPTERTGGKESLEGAKSRGGGQVGENQHKKGGRRSNKAGGKRRNADHSSNSNNSTGVGEPSACTSKPSQQDPIRQFSTSSFVIETDSEHRPDMDPIGDAMSFRALPSPTSNPDFIVDSASHDGVEHGIPPTPAVGDTGVKSDLVVGESEWPEFNELVAESSKPVSAMLVENGMLETGDGRPGQLRPIKKRGRTGSKQVQRVCCVFMHVENCW